MKALAADPSSFDKAPSPATLPGFRWVIVAMLIAVSFVLFVDRNNIGIANPYIQKEFGYNDLAMGMVLSAFMFGYALGLVPGGWLADRFGPWRVLAVASFSWAVLTVLIALTRSRLFGLAIDPRITFIAARFLLGLCEACAYPTFSRAMANWMRRSERATAMGLIQAGSGLGGAATPILIAWIIQHWGWRLSFLISGVITFAVALAWWALAADHPLEHPRVSKRELDLILEGREETRAQPADRHWYARLVRSGNFYALCVSQFFFGIAGFAYYSWFFKYFKDVRKVEDAYAARLYSLTFLTLALGAMAGGLIGDRVMKRWGAPWGRRLVPLLAITLGGCLGLVAPAIANDTASAVVFALAAGALYLAASGFWSTAIDLTRRGTGILGGLMNAANWLGAGLATLCFPLVQKNLLGWEGTLQCAGIAGILSGLAWLTIDSSRQIDT
jgi:ACS family glucarate transporter-like MFS transporter